MPIKKTPPSIPDGAALLQEAVQRIEHANPDMPSARRSFLRHSLTLGG